MIYSKIASPKHITIPEMVEEIYGVVLCEGRVIVEEIPKAIGIPTERVH